MLGLCRRNEVALCARLLKVSAEALQQNWGILPFVLLAQLVSAVIVLPLLGFNAFAYANGHVVPNGPPCCPPLDTHAMCWVLMQRISCLCTLRSDISSMCDVLTCR